MNQARELAKAINSLPRHFMGAHGLPDTVTCGVDDVKDLGGFQDITASVKRGVLSIADKASAADTIVYKSFMIAGFLNHGDSIDIYLMDGTTTALIAYPITIQYQNIMKTLLQNICYLP